MPSPVILIGPSGVGKTHLANRLIQQYPDQFAIGVSHTTRKPRVGEKDGVDYHFVSPRQMRALHRANALAEHVWFHGNEYGLSHGEVSDILASGRHCVLVMNLHGAELLHGLGLAPMCVLLKPPSLETLRERMIARGDTAESVELRMAAAEEELRASEQSDLIRGSVVSEGDITDHVLRVLE